MCETCADYQGLARVRVKFMAHLVGAAVPSAYLCRPLSIPIGTIKATIVDTRSYKTRFANEASVTRAWHVVDADGKTLGRLCSRIAHVLRGKHKPDFTPHFDNGDHIIVINAEKIRLTGKKMTDKIYLSYSGYPGGQKETTPARLMATKPTAVIEKAVRGMLPKNRLGRAQIKKLFVYAGAEHQHAAQQPKPLEL